jgi:hypothetical protein
MTTASNKNPASTFFWNDWENDPELKACSLAAQGLWMRCLCIAARSTEPGVVLVKGQPSDRKDLPGVLARLVGQPAETLAPLLDELIATETASIDRKGRLICRRMVRAAAVSQKRSVSGGLGAEVTNDKKRGKRGLPTENGGKSPGNSAGEDDAKPPGKRSASSILQSSDSLNPTPSPGAARRGTEPWVGCGLAVKAVMAEHWPNTASVEMAQTGICAQWIADGWDIELDILPAVRTVCADMADRGLDPPGSLKYFTKAVERRHAERIAAGSAGGDETDAEAKLKALIERKYAETGVWETRWNWREHWGTRPDQRPRPAA